MKAQVVHTLDGSLRFEEVERPPLPPGHVRIGVRAVGVNFPDLLLTEGRYQFRPELPFSPGAEAAGEAIEVAEGVTSVAAGDRVFGFSTHGAMAEEFVVPADAVFPLPAEIDHVTGAAVAMAYGTGYHALVDRGRLRPDETLLVTGATGGVGSAAVQLGTKLGARVIAAVGSPSKVGTARELGADEVVVHDDGAGLRDAVKDLTDGRGADVVFDPVGGDTFLQALRAVAWEGRLLVVGFASGTIPEAPMNLPLLKGSSIVGVFWGDFARRDPARNRANFEQITRWIVDGAVHPLVSRVFPLAEAPAALEMLGSRQATGKVVLSVP